MTVWEVETNKKWMFLEKTTAADTITAAAAEAAAATAAAVAASERAAATTTTIHIISSNFCNKLRSHSSRTKLTMLSLSSDIEFDRSMR